MNSRRHPITTSLPKLMEDLLARALCLHAEGRNNSQEITTPSLSLGLNSLTDETMSSSCVMMRVMMSISRWGSSLPLRGDA